MVIDRKFKFNFLLIDNDVRLVDQNVIEYRFVNIGEVDAVLNNNFLLQANNPATNLQKTFDENMKTDQKTAQSYSIVFDKNAAQTAKKKIQVIQKIEVFDK